MYNATLGGGGERDVFWKAHRHPLAAGSQEMPLGVTLFRRTVFSRTPGCSYRTKFSTPFSLCRTTALGWTLSLSIREVLAGGNREPAFDLTMHAFSLGRSTSKQHHSLPPPPPPPPDANQTFPHLLVCPVNPSSTSAILFSSWASSSGLCL